MRVSVVACGESAREWYKTPCDLSIGVNDASKFGHNTKYLVVVNSPFKFYPTPKNGGINRLEIIKSSKPERFFCHNRNWRTYFKNFELLPLKPFIGRLAKGRVYCSKTSPFVAITLAWTLGATEIILFGIDMLNHHTYKPGERYFNYELSQYLQLFKCLEKEGVKLYIGNEDTILKDYLHVYK